MHPLPSPHTFKEGLSVEGCAVFLPQGLIIVYLARLGRPALLVLVHARYCEFGTEIDTALPSDSRQHFRRCPRSEPAVGGSTGVPSCPPIMEKAT